MKKKFLSPIKRFTLGSLLTCFLIFVGIILNQTYRMTIEEHLMMGVDLIKTDGPRAVAHLKIAQKSPRKEARMLSSLYLARIYHHGSVVISQNFPKAVDYYEQAAQYDIAEAQYALALFYDAGDKVPENKEKAIDYMKKAAKVSPEAKYALGVWMERGYLGNTNMDEVVALYTQAAHQGVIHAIKSLISIYHGGYGGFPQNLQQELYWREQLNQRMT